MTTRRLETILDNLIDCLDTLSREFGNSSSTVSDDYLDLHYHACDLAEAVDDRVTYESELAVGLLWLVETHTYEDALCAARNLHEELLAGRDESDFRVDDDRTLD